MCPRAASLALLLAGCSGLGSGPASERPSDRATAPAPAPGRSALAHHSPPDATPPSLTVSELDAERIVVLAPRPAPSPPPVVEEPPELVAVAREAFVFSRPNARSPKLGYLRLGARIKRAPESSGNDGCEGGWYRVWPDGYVCSGPTASLVLDHPMAELAAPQPERDAGLPYAYARSENVPPPLYVALPSHERTTAVEGSARRSRSGTTAEWEDIIDEPVPSLLASGGRLPTAFGYQRGELRAPRRPVANSAFALLSSFEHEGRRFGLTTLLELVPLDRVRRVRSPDFHGVVLDGERRLPIAFVRSKRALLYRGSPELGLAIRRPLAFREAVALSGKSARLGGLRYLETREGDWLRDGELVRIDEPARPPRIAAGSQPWIHVSIKAQTLVAYVGAEPVYVTLVSTGRDGLGDPEETLSTPLGEFLIHTKHVSATMSGDEVGDEFDLGDVPYVQYFSGGYALHAAYWHDAFGTPRSHGCVNLSPLDARYLFHFTAPAVPRGWHGAFSLREGTLISIRP